MAVVREYHFHYVDDITNSGLRELLYLKVANLKHKTIMNFKYQEEETTPEVPEEETPEEEESEE